MQKNNRKIQKKSKVKNYYIIIGLLIMLLGIIVFNNLTRGKNSEITKAIDTEKIGQANTIVEEVSSSIGKKVNETNNTVEKIAVNTSNMNKTNTTSNKKNNVEYNDTTTTNKKDVRVDDHIDPKKEIIFIKPVEGEVIKEFAKDNLIYSETLNEWITHLGIDLKANKTEIVKASASGTIKAIKNDPRYGLTITIEHEDGYKTLYANLLTSEFVVEGEKVEQGQTIGTVGNTSVFESTEDEHLHFEILKDNINIDPTTVLK